MLVLIAVTLFLLDYNIGFNTLKLTTIYSFSDEGEPTFYSIHQLFIYLRMLLRLNELKHTCLS